MMRIDLVDEDGENRAVRSFLMQWGVTSLTVGAMRAHMTRSGWGEESIPAFARNAYSAEHLTKAGAQLWIRHLMGLEEVQHEYWREGTKLIKACLAKAVKAAHEDAPFPLDAEQARLWHRAQLEAFRHSLEMMGVPEDRPTAQRAGDQKGGA